LQIVVCGKGAEEAGGARGVDPFEEFQKDPADAIAMG